VAASALVGGLLAGSLLLGAPPATAIPGDPSGGDPQSVGLQVDVSGVTSQSQVDADAENAVPGGALGVRGSGLVALTPYDVHLHSHYAPPAKLATVISLADGTFALSTLLPGTTQPGAHFVRVTDPVTGVHLDTAEFQVGAAVGPGETTGGTGAAPGAGNGGGPGELAATGPLAPRPAGPDAEADTSNGLAFTGATLAGTIAAAGALVVTGAVVATAATRRRRRARTT
jgi:hypothetical protein